KKANRACFHCQKAHLTCDDARPCARCIKRGLQDNCTDGIRKKAKYLLEDDELANSQDFSFLNPSPSLDPNLSDSFTSEALNMEFNILSQILGNSQDVNGKSWLDSPSNGSPPANPAWPASPQTDSGALSGLPHGIGGSKKIFEIVTQPYDYTQGYHFLMRFLKEKFAKNDILRIVRALAIFRPSIIALQMPLSLDDEVFVERCFQRSLLELEKLMAFTGTPTVVWRRTGEICLVADEFLLLTGWERSELLPTPMQTQGSSGGRDQPSRKYIYELFDPTSTVEYWENFAQHAFENATHSVSSHCALLRPDGSPVLCSFCFTVRRDMFDLPSLIVGKLIFSVYF
ncbi:transcription activator of gluconeogenesis ERT1, partial [Flagelloscypha sp. PMI_526]